MKKWLRAELGKLAPMTGKQRWEYIWEYYKLPLIVAAVMIMFSVSMIQNSLTCINNKSAQCLVTLSGFQIVEKASQSSLREQRIKSNHFLSGRVPDRKYISGCKCASCAPPAHKECARQTAKSCRKAPKGIFDSLKSAQCLVTLSGFVILQEPEQPYSPGLGVLPHSCR